ncbi:hypothetical protein, conserved [Entamoeba dispar SAW760]|uniref:Uncharacterized protein n=1 Tax=Entamoeba dispar (strain ATCC PRA-260 / SAW760) TaxID=370354 RepID=B0EFU5_ENTDS|nr:uncharacterized protein EDI_231210 [Entamoeba dispar SAW760]EDR26602.1 hypothetical protein, conserved [Entamoeba dispar SAW760]|eukprot:EDR26602.1 hypothetical protein, conserved [Entamoeba dispar SAW760]
MSQEKKVESSIIFDREKEFQIGTLVSMIETTRKEIEENNLEINQTTPKKIKQPKSLVEENRIEKKKTNQPIEEKEQKLDQETQNQIEKKESNTNQEIIEDKISEIKGNKEVLSNTINSPQKDQKLEINVKENTTIAKEDLDKNNTINISHVIDNLNVPKTTKENKDLSLVEESKQQIKEVETPQEHKVTNKELEVSSICSNEKNENKKVECVEEEKNNISLVPANDLVDKKEPNNIIKTFSSQEQIKASQCRESLIHTERLMATVKDNTHHPEEKVVSTVKYNKIETPRKRASVSRITLLEDSKKNQKPEFIVIKEDVIPHKKESITRISDGSRFSVKKLSFDENEQEEIEKENLQHNSPIKGVSQMEEIPIEIQTPNCNKNEEISGISSISRLSDKMREETKPSKGGLMLDKSRCSEFKRKLSLVGKKIGEETEHQIKKPVPAISINLFNSSILQPRGKRTKTLPCFNSNGRLCSLEKDMEKDEQSAYSLLQNTHINLNQDMEEDELENEMGSIQLNIRLSNYRNSNI